MIRMSRTKFKIGDYVEWYRTGHIGRIVRPCRSFNDSWCLDTVTEHGYNSCSEEGLRLSTKEAYDKFILKYLLIYGY